jgi:rod shape determining protein RodA
MQSSLAARRGELTLLQKLGQVNLGLILLISAVACIGFAMLYSAGGGNFEPWAGRQISRFFIGLAIMVVIAVIDIRLWFRFAYVIWIGAIILLVAVHVVGQVGMGAQRWLAIGPVQIQPSELAKTAVVIVLARYFHGIDLDEIGNPLRLVWPLLLSVIPAFLIFKQPKLGSALVLMLATGIIFWAAGVRLWKFLLVAAAAGGAVPVAWQFLRDYQKQRVLTFLNPENDPLGSGYHIIQSKIALGSGGIWGKGFLQGTQAQLQFLPEKQTDFIFTMLSEEFGIVGGLTLIGLYALIIVYGFAIALRARSQFGRLMATGIMAGFYLNAMINMGMVMGLLPVVGEPLPLVSYGGTSMITLLASFGLLVNVYVHRDVHIGRRGALDGP